MSRLALVTGGSRGIGRATADLLRARGWDVLAPGREVLDFTSQIKVTDYWLKFGLRQHRLDALIFCHGTWYSEPISKQYLQTYYNQLHERVLTPFDLIVPMRDYLKKASGCVVMVASTQAFGGRAETGPYGAACAAQVRLIQGLAQSKDGIRYNVVAPGLTQTDMAAQVQATGDCRPDAVPQPAGAVAAAIVGLVEGDDNGVVLRVVDGQVTRARWVWE